MIRPSAPTFATTKFGRVSPAGRFRFDAFGFAAPDGYTVKNVFCVGDVAVTFTTTAPTPDAGTPPRPNTGNDNA